MSAKLKEYVSAMERGMPMFVEHQRMRSWCWFIGTTVVKYAILVGLILFLPWPWPVVFIALYILHLLLEIRTFKVNLELKTRGSAATTMSSGMSNNRVSQLSGAAQAVAGWTVSRQTSLR